MKKIVGVLALFALLVAMALPALAQTDDSLGTGQQPPTEEPTAEPTDEPTTLPGGETEQPTEEPTTLPGGETEQPTDEPTTAPAGGEEPTVEARDEVQDQQQLADTGIDSAMIAVAAGGLLLAGGVALLLSRRTGKAGR